MKVTQDLVCNSIYTQSSPGERSGKFSQNGKFGQNGIYKFSQECYVWSERRSAFPHVSSFVHDCGCVVNGDGAMAAI